jgi:membrane protease YdiL (CAAX protease family)
LKGSIAHYPWLGKLLILTGLFLIAEVVFTYIGMGIAHLVFPSTDFLHIATRLGDEGFTLVADSTEVRALLLYQSISALGRFLLVPFLYCYLEGISTASSLGLDRLPAPVQWAWIIPIMVAAAVITGFVYEWNHSISLPERWAGLDEQLRELESQAQRMTDAFLSTASISGLLLNLLVVGVVAAVSEELIFRGLVQRIFQHWTGSGHLAVWLAAFAFSFIHLQFFGFFPRLLLGAVLGYLYLYSGSLWAPIAGHFFNNAMAVTIYYLNTKGIMEVDPTESATLWQALLFIPVFGLFMWQYIRSKRNGERLDAGI